MAERQKSLLGIKHQFKSFTKSYDEEEKEKVGPSFAEIMEEKISSM